MINFRLSIKNQTYVFPGRNVYINILINIFIEIGIILSIVQFGAFFNGVEK
jgi:hypothetical protein